MPERAEQEPEARSQVERLGGHDEAPVDPGARELDDITRVALDDRALHAELLLGHLGPAPRGLARLGEPERVLATDVDVGHGEAFVDGREERRSSLALERGK